MYTFNFKMHLRTELHVLCWKRIQFYIMLCWIRLPSTNVWTSQVNGRIPYISSFFVYRLKAMGNFVSNLSSQWHTVVTTEHRSAYSRWHTVIMTEQCSAYSRWHTVVMTEHRSAYSRWHTVVTTEHRSAYSRWHTVLMTEHRSAYSRWHTVLTTEHHSA